MRNHIFFISVFVLQSIFINVLPVQQIPAGKEPADLLNRHTVQTSQQKLYIHFNKERFSAGDKIWFNAYLLDAVTHVPDTANTNVYVDLITSGGVLMNRSILLATNGTAEGSIDLPLDIPDGNYFLRAYTDWMKNFDEEFFFSKYFYISNTKYEDIIPRSEVRSNRRFNKDLEDMAEDYRIAFFPEGGNMVYNVNNRVAFKAIDALGHGIDVEGVVVDQSGDELLNFSTIHGGMGSFEYTPVTGSVYRAMVSFNGSRAQEFELPLPVNDGIAVKVERDDGDILIELLLGLPDNDPAYINEVMLIAHTRGDVKFSESLSVIDGEASTVIPGNLFPGGIAHLTVFSSESVPVAERLVFINREESVTFAPRVLKMEHEGVDYFGIQINVADADGNPVEGHFSMSVLEGGFNSPGMSENILSNILISSDLKGVIQNPQYYLDPEKDLSAELDHLMMTHGWRRFNWNNVLSDELPEFVFQPTSSIVVRGRLLDPAENEPVSNLSVQMKVLSGHDDSYTAMTSNRGIFEFSGLDYPDEFRVEISSRRLPGDYPPDIELLTGDIKGFEYTPNIYTTEQQTTNRSRNWKRVADAGTSPYSVAPDKGPAAQQYGIPDQTIYIDREKITHRSVYDVLVERAQGLQVSGNSLTFRGPTSINLSNEPMFMLDGVQSSRDGILTLNPREVERIELFRGTSAAIFGVRGGGGVIIVYSRQAGDFGMQDSKEYLMVGYHSPREFFSDVLSSMAGSSRDDEPAVTVYWQSDISTGEDGTGTVYFPSEGISNTMKLVIEGVGKNGELGFGEFTLELE